LIGLGVVDEIVPEPEGGAHRDHELAAANLGIALRQNLERIIAQPIEKLMQQRYEKFRKLGKYTEGEAAAAVASS
jgi:acetyl-CoA carboxylase carboxyl transferase subunit alpha